MATLYFNECNQIRYATLQLVRNRLAQVVPGLKQRAYYDINPTGIGHWTNQEFGMFGNPETRKPLPDPENYKRTFINLSDNSQNLSPKYLALLQNASEADRRRFWLGQYSAETSWALWTYERLEKIRCTEVPVFARIVVAVDQSGQITQFFFGQALKERAVLGGQLYATPGPTVSAITAPRWPNGLGAPTVELMAVWCSISAFSLAPTKMTTAESHIHIIMPITAPSAP